MCLFALVNKTFLHKFVFRFFPFYIGISDFSHFTLVFQIFPILHWYFRFSPFYIGISDFPHFTLVFQIFSFYIGISDFPHFTLVFQIQISDYDDIHKEVDYV